MKLTRPEEFKKFIHFLLKKAPEAYEPHLFRCGENSKAPALEYGSWKAEKNRLLPHQAISWIERGRNIGIAAMPGDPLVNTDIDDDEKTKKKDLKPTLMARSRSRTGIHAWYFSEDEIPNIPTDHAGEIRARGQYVIAPGSYVPTDPEEVPEGEGKNAGRYTVEEAVPVAWIEYDELPEVFLKEKEKSIKDIPKRREFDPQVAKGEHSALFDITARDVVLREGGETNPSKRWSAVFHGSTTDANMSLSERGLLHCWRHGVSHNGLQALTVLSGYMTCQEAGTPHKNSGAGGSRVIGDDGAIFYAWLEAKKRGYIPADDPIPVRAINHIARGHDLYDPKKGELLPKWAYNKVLQIVKEKY